MGKEHFPRGLTQPEGSFRFSIDALLLARFCTPGRGQRIIDLGCGCGVAGLSVLLRGEDTQLTGVDIQPSLVEAAGHNAAMLGLSERFTPLCADVEHLFAAGAETGGGFDLALANPPYRLLSQGRLPQDESRRLALFGDERTLALFSGAAGRALKNRGRFCCIMDASRLSDLIVALAEARLGLRKFLPVYPKQGEPACLVLVEAQKNCTSDTVTLPPLVLYGGSGLTAEALAFCPELACNKRAG